MVGTYCTKQKKNIAYYRPIYRSYNWSMKEKYCDGQTLYSAAKIESVILEAIVNNEDIQLVSTLNY